MVESLTRQIRGLQEVLIKVIKSGEDKCIRLEKIFLSQVH